MSWKAIDLQMAVHRNSDAGLQQSQLQQKPVEDQAALAEQNGKQAAQDTHKTGKTPEAGEAGIRERGQRGGDSQKGQKKKKGMADREDERDAPHPYKGRFIDLQL
ncbi:hypothetical protein J31TS4_01190 [Paenibacillus sp. J31TS4]|uniref:hypothetical protein n=1 Tax=Paenibacillus sp. J31TS4 TaxID=2807195 RepID=UPI001B2CF707|nr:hypothetical protein [Paenibacillus sp. J31TS4]GIP36839.1 hypothetical protein J31TS4_01190 [Paenibacillus sp. J31TS4]